MEVLLAFCGVTEIGYVTWAHRVNSQHALHKYLSDSHTMMLEADILKSASGQIIMAHPPETSSDLSFDEFIERVVLHNKNPASSRKKGVKLDFKTPLVVDYCIKKLLNIFGSTAEWIPIFLNADILTGPGGSQTSFDAPVFISQCKELLERSPQWVVLSVGWTTSNKAVEYTQQHVDSMLSACSACNNSLITFPIRASIIQKSWEQLQRLLHHQGGVQRRSLTVWNSEVVGEASKEWLRKNTSTTTCLYDIMDANKEPVYLWCS